MTTLENVLLGGLIGSSVVIVDAVLSRRSKHGSYSVTVRQRKQSVFGSNHVELMVTASTMKEADELLDSSLSAITTLGVTLVEESDPADAE